MLIGIVGSRSITDYTLFKEELEKVIVPDPKQDMIVSGGADGVDSLAEQYARAHGIQPVILPALWDNFGKAAGKIRNSNVVKVAHIIVAFWDQESPGTKDTIDKAEANGNLFEVIRLRPGQTSENSIAGGEFFE